MLTSRPNSAEDSTSCHGERSLRTTSVTHATYHHRQSCVVFEMSSQTQGGPRDINNHQISSERRTTGKIKPCIPNGAILACIIRQYKKRYEQIFPTDVRPRTSSLPRRHGHVRDTGFLGLRSVLGLRVVYAREISFGTLHHDTDPRRWHGAGLSLSSVSLQDQRRACVAVAQY
jgi:hypothetical protein